MQVRIRELEDRDRFQALRISDAVLGDGFLKELLSEPGRCGVKTAVAAVDDHAVGFVVYCMEQPGFEASSNLLSKAGFSDGARRSSALGALGHIKTVAISADFQGRGIGRSLVLHAENELCACGAETIVVFGWTSPSGTHIGSIMDGLGYQQVDMVERYWSEDSIAKGYGCAVCGHPCVCSVKLYERHLPVGTTCVE